MLHTLLYSPTKARHSSRSLNGARLRVSSNDWNARIQHAYAILGVVDTTAYPRDFLYQKLLKYVKFWRSYSKRKETVCFLASGRPNASILRYLATSMQSAPLYRIKPTSQCNAGTRRDNPIPACHHYDRMSCSGFAVQFWISSYIPSWIFITLNGGEEEEVCVLPTESLLSHSDPQQFKNSWNWRRRPDSDPRREAFSFAIYAHYLFIRSVPLSHRYSCPLIAIAIAKDCYILFVLFKTFLVFFPSTDFSTSFSRFLRNVATRHQNSLCPMRYLYVPLKNAGRKSPIFANFRTQSRHFEPHHSTLRGKSGNLQQ